MKTRVRRWLGLALVAVLMLIGLALLLDKNVATRVGLITQPRVRWVTA